MSEEKGDKGVPLPVMAVVIVLAVTLLGAVMWQTSRPPSRGGSDIAAVVDQIKAKPNTPTVPPELIAQDVLSRSGRNKNVGQKR
jgi:hypothetical protein